MTIATLIEYLKALDPNMEIQALVVEGGEFQFLIPVDEPDEDEEGSGDEG